MAEAPITVFVDGAGRDALPLDPRQRVRWSMHSGASGVAGTEHPSVDVLRRTRRNVHTIKGAAPGVNLRTSCRGSRGSASLPSPSPPKGSGIFRRSR
jgi:hypothetical protein